MRVSDARMFELTRRRLDESRERLAQKQDVAMTGVRVQKPSDDPVASARAQALESASAQSTSHLRSAMTASHSLGFAETALADAGDVMTRLKELAVQASSETISASDRAAIASEVTSLRGNMLSLANTRAGDRYIFGGRADASPPFAASGVYSGDVVVREVEVGANQRVPLGVSGDVAFGAGGGTDIFAAIDAFAVALQANDINGVRAGIGGFDAAITQVTDARSALGASLASVEVAVSVSERILDRTSTDRADLIEVDQASAILDFMQAQQAMETATALATKLSVGELARSR